MSTKKDETPPKIDPKQKPVKRPAKPRLRVLRSIAYINNENELIRVKAGSLIDEATIPDDALNDYKTRQDVERVR